MSPLILTPLHRASWFSTSIGGHTKRAVAIRFIISVGKLGGTIDRQVYHGSDANGNVRDHITCVAAIVCSAFVTLAIEWLLARENKSGPVSARGI